MSWTLIRGTWPRLPADTSPLLEIFREHGVENTAEEGGSIAGCIADAPASEEQIQHLSIALRAVGAEIEIGPYEEVDWDAQWRAHFKPRRVGKRFMVTPTWEAPALKSGDLVITLDPGEAFGTGDHPTTRMCLAALEDVITNASTVLDLGCGSGILAIGAARLGAAEVVGVDIEPVSVAVARENGRLNDVAVEWRVGDVLDEFPDRTWTVVISNIISATLIAFAPLAARLVAPGGTWIVSGILAANWSSVRSASEREGFRLLSSHEEGEWTCALFTRLSGSG